MSRNNGTFKYKTVQESEQDENGFYTSSTDSEWLDGCECYIEKCSPAKQLIGTDGQVFIYSYEIYIPKYFKANLSLTDKLKLFGEDGSEDEISIMGIDDYNRKVTIVWG
ncbi:MAG: hypothetical protein LBE04_01865 [Prevotellaceae bacterium]|jgi:hypothetical protein|nr:hypothetical protein [Prevotellaceae bacterium]